MWPAYETDKKLSFYESFYETASSLSETVTNENSAEIYQDYSNGMTSSELGDAGYNLPIAGEEQAAAEADCLAALEKIQILYRSISQNTEKRGSSNVMLSEKVIGEMTELLGAEGIPVFRSDSSMESMLNYAKMHQFLEHALDGFGTSIPDVTKISENVDGTITVTVDVVCKMAGEAAVYTHEVTLRLLADGGVKYLGNHMRD